MKQTKEVEVLAEKLHKWYLEATKKLNPESYNPHAQKKYADLTEEQKFIDRYISNKFQEAIQAERQRLLEGLEEIKGRKYKTGERPWCVVCLNRITKEFKELINKQQ